MRNKLYCLTPYFNPAGYLSRRRNYTAFAAAMRRQNVPLITVELAFGDQGFELPESASLRLRTNSVLWQKERMLNHALAHLPDDCAYVAWVDGDLLFGDDGWGARAVDELQRVDVLQLYQNVHFLPPMCMQMSAEHGGNGGFGAAKPGVIWQHQHHSDWLYKRKNHLLPYAEPGFAWAVRREVIAQCGLYDKLILGSGDALFVDACLGSWGIHPYWQHSPGQLKQDMLEWAQRLGENRLRCGYLPQDIFHLFHGTRKHRAYQARQQILLKNDYDPALDVAVVQGALEWTSARAELRREVRQYFFDRQEDALV